MTTALDIIHAQLETAKLQLLFVQALDPRPGIWRPAQRALVAEVRRRVRAYDRAQFRLAFDRARAVSQRLGGTEPSRAPYIPGAWTGD
jgi:hypothetical protein